MKKIIVALSVLVTLSAGTNAIAQQKGATKPKPTATAETSIVGKWHLVDAKFKQMPPNATPEQIKESMVAENMVYEFTAAGKVIATGKSMPANEANYTRKGKVITLKDDKDPKTENMNILSVSDKELTLELPAEGMTFIFEKM